MDSHRHPRTESDDGTRLPARAGVSVATAPWTRVAALDATAALLSGVCLVHCLLTPVVLTLLPVMGAVLFTHEAFHQLLLLFVLPTSLVGLWLGCRRHKNGAVAVLGGIGMALITLAAFGHATFGIEGERWLTSAGGVILAASHFLNFRRCRALRCEETESCGMH
jgi:hypothetical protein